MSAAVLTGQAHVPDALLFAPLLAKGKAALGIARISCARCDPRLGVGSVQERQGIGRTQQSWLNLALGAGLDINLCDSGLRAVSASLQLGGALPTAGCLAPSLEAAAVGDGTDLGSSGLCGSIYIARVQSCRRTLSVLPGCVLSLAHASGAAVQVSCQLPA